MKAPPCHLFPPAAEPPTVRFFSLRNADRSPRHGGLSPSECHALVTHARRHYAPQQATIGHATTSQVNRELRRSTVRWLDYADPDLYWLSARITRLFREANMRTFGFDIDGPLDLQFTEYDARDRGQYDWHSDSSIIGLRPCDRKLTLVIQLSSPEDYDGGRFEMEGKTFTETEFAEQGSAIVFPSYARHKAGEVTRGIRRSLVAWAWGPVR